MHSTAMPATVSVLSDGNCLYRTVSYIICGNQIHHKVRACVVNFMRNNDDLLKHTRPSECSVDEYLTTTLMDKIGTWGTEVEIFAVATMTYTQVYVFSRHGIHYQWLKYTPVLRDGDSPMPSCDLHTGEAIYISNIGQHFEPVRPIDSV